MQRRINQRNWRAVSTATIVLCLIGCCSRARGDGGVLQLSQRCGQCQVSVFTSPAVPRVGPLDVSVLVQDAATQTIRDDVPVTIRLIHAEGLAIPLQATATGAAATNRLFQGAQFDITATGTWRVTVELPELGAEPLSFDLEVAPPLPPWLQLAPWVGWPCAVVALFLIHQWLSARRNFQAKIANAEHG